MGKTLEKDILQCMITLLLIRAIYVYFTKTPFISVSCIGVAIGVILGRIVFYMRKRANHLDHKTQEERK